MIICSRIADLRRQVREWRAQGDRIALVPTMGNLHPGHLELVRRAQQPGQRVLVSLFVNPLQFGPREDFAAYPRTPEADRRLLEQVGADLQFTPAADEVYPRGLSAHTRVEVPEISDMLCGASRPGHFAGVATVVCKLLQMAQPDLALFGEKDFQQLLVIRRMVEDLCMPVEIQGLATVREADGLAMSSRNAYLTAEERAQAPRLYQALRNASAALIQGCSRPDVERIARAELESAGFRPDYVSVRRAQDLAVPEPGDRELVILAAAYLGRARLIDNLKLNC